MRNLLSFLMMFAVFAFLGGCGGKDAEVKKDTHSHDGQADHSHDDDDHGHEHGDDDDHGHEHGDEDEDDDGHDDAVNLGKQASGDYTVEIIAYGGIEAGHDGHTDILVEGGEPIAIRLWVGLEDGVGSVKSLAEKEGEGQFHSHFDIDENLKEGSKFWVELEIDNGRILLLSFDI